MHRHIASIFTKWEDEGYFLISNSHVMETTIARFRACTMPTRLRWVKGHSGDPGNDGADCLARAATEKDAPDIVDLTIPPVLKMRGARLVALTQTMAYKIIRKIKVQAEPYQAKLDRNNTNRNVQLALAAANKHCRVEITREELDLNRSACFFLWMVVHDGYIVRRHWKHINSCEDRIECKKCGTEESMDHILTRCDAPGQREVWELAKRLWQQKTKTDLIITKGLIMSCGIQPPSVHRSHSRKGIERFCRILISESAHLIWKMRNNCVINGKEHYSLHEIEQRKKAIRKFLVLTMWQGALVNESSLQEDWTKDSGVLVGMVK
ncbi:hypothetical protein IW261DRAFT_1553664 [Armillaria novae-zelandiae]|uniref:RNase H type-1 domain-containing protein n=1 Tax=Armillaria novae-zelandiae TaxID=153914 RepID=A0AA39NS44_9AGAR|nr:hypothetical protein IW261DRAFT_1553664 [Armillaria novae-zelandiae]